MRTDILGIIVPMTYMAGYGNTTSAVNAIRFQMSSGNIDDGIIKLYGVKNHNGNYN
jgi:hypothetical protein